MLRTLRSLRILFSLPAILLVLGTSCMGINHYKLPENSLSALRTAAEAGDAPTVRRILQEVKEGKGSVPLSEIRSILNRVAEKGYGEVIQVILEAGEEYLTISDLQKAYGCAQMCGHSKIAELIQEYIAKKEQPKKEEECKGTLTEAGKLIKEILEGNIVDVESNRANIREVVKKLSSIVGYRQTEIQKDLKKHRKKIKLIRQLQQLDAISVSLRSISDRDGSVKELEGAASKSIQEIKEKVKEIGNRLYKIQQQLEKIEEESNSTVSQETPTVSSRPRETPTATKILRLTAGVDGR